MAAKLDMVRGRVVVTYLDENGRPDRHVSYDPDFAEHFARRMIETAEKAREWSCDEAEYLADCRSE